jgi:Zn-dependent oligopeptidase
MESTITLIVGGLLGGLIKYIFDELKSRSDFHHQAYDTLFKERWNYYQKLWAVSGGLPEWPRNEDLTANDLRDISQRMKDWYFDKGGMMLSQEARQQYGRVQQKLTEVWQKTEDKQAKITDDLYESVRVEFSHLRGQMTEDLFSRIRNKPL